MKIACITFTKEGLEIAQKVKKDIGSNVDIYFKDDLKENLKDKIEKIFYEYNCLIFISSAGIALRLIAPYIKHKSKDPAVVVVDDMGNFAISLLSGHIGGANEITKKIADILKCTPVITTASDVRGIESVDMFAKKYGFFIESFEDAKKITSMMLEGKRIGIISEMNLCLKYGNIVKENADGYIVITCKESFNIDKSNCILRPKILNVGIGCRRGKSKEEIINAIKSVFLEEDLSLKCIKFLCSIDIKKDEKGIIDACEYLKCDFKTFTKDEIEKVQDRFDKSDFVFEKVKVTSVAEPCAYLLGEIIVKKRVFDGITIAVSKEV
ncbi:MAG: cobalt-precorrin 5A hydrolase [Caloramator sp.]|nr:cobalt-precorrin 5A hydrolase [Caloramator sp.]